MFDLAEIAAANFISQIEDIEDRNFGLGPAQELATGIGKCPILGLLDITL